MRKNYQSAALTLVFDSSKTFILLVKRCDVPVWVLPGGGIDPGETPKEAAAREVFEESGLKVGPLTAVAHFQPINRLSQETWLFSGISEDGILTNTDESNDAAFFRVSELPESLFYIHRQWIHEVLEAKDLVARPLHEITYGNVLKYFLKNPLTFLRYFLSWLGFPLNHREGNY